MMIGLFCFAGFVDLFQNNSELNGGKAPRMFAPAGDKADLTRFLPEDKFRWVGDRGCVDIGKLRLDTYWIRGQTSGSIVYYLEKQHVLFSGQCLQVMGVAQRGPGVTAEDMAKTIDFISHLPPETKVYTDAGNALDNAKFSLVVEPKNEATQERALALQAQSDHGAPMVPTSIELERNTNPFLTKKNRHYHHES